MWLISAKAFFLTGKKIPKWPFPRLPVSGVCWTAIHYIKYIPLIDIDVVIMISIEHEIPEILIC